MKKELIKSYNDHISKLRGSHGVLVSGPGGYHHNHNKDVVEAAIHRMEAAVVRLENQ